MNKITFVTGNKDKVRETQEILQIPLEIADIDVDEIQELDLEKVAMHKLEQAYDRIKAPVMIDDVSVTLDAWDGFPGPLVKWVLKTTDGTPEMLLKMLSNEKNRKATATLAIGYADGKQKKLFYGEIHGTIGYEIKGENGFGWDKVFIMDNDTKTLAEYSPDEKNAISHRRRALDKLKDFLMSQERI